MKFLKLNILIILLSLYNITFSANLPVENVFSDINSNYKYYNQLQYLYDNGVILPNNDGKFLPDSLIRRDEFVGISMESSCKKCTKPNTKIEYINNYGITNTYFDLLNTNKFYYCGELATDKNYINLYDKGAKCEDNTFIINKSPFCPNNYVSLEEAISIVLRNANVFSETDNNNVIDEINSGNISNDLSTDVTAKNKDGTANEFYGYLKKGLEYSIDEYDNLGNKISYKLLEIKNGKIYPKKLITKEEFLMMSYISLKTNSCKNIKQNSRALKIEIIDSTCNSYISNCTLANINNNVNKYDLKGFSTGSCINGIDEINGYIWKFYNNTDGNEIIKYGNYLNDFIFPSNGYWSIYLSVQDKCNNVGEVFNSIIIDNTNTNNNISVTIDADSFYGSTPFSINFNAIAKGGNGEYTYDWDYGDSEKGNTKSNIYTYGESGFFNVLLTVSDSNGSTGRATMIVNTISSGNCEFQDIDNDGINDCNDLCKNVYGSSINKGCPIITLCGNDCSCPSGKICNESNKSLCSIKGVCIESNSDLSGEVNNITNKCLEKYNKNKIYGNVICNSCPCLSFIDYKAITRKCDYIFPAITSSGSSDIFSAGEIFELN